MVINNGLILVWLNAHGNKSIPAGQDYTHSVLYPITLRSNGIRVVGSRNANLIQNTLNPSITGCDIKMHNGNSNNAIPWSDSHLIVIGY